MSVDDRPRAPADGSPGGDRALLGRIAREPVTHFAMLAVLLFGVAEVAERTRAPIIEVDPAEVEARIRQMERAKGSALSEDERALAELAHVDELILAREAMELGLDDDARIRAILSQKMLHVMSMDLEQPSDAELRAYYEEHHERYAVPPSVTVDQVLVVGGERGSGAEQVGAPPVAADAEQLARSERFEHTLLRGVTRDELALTYGPATAGLILRAPRGEWAGPHATDRGPLWFRTIDRSEAAPPPSFEAVVGQVRFDWMSEHEEPYLQRRVDELRRRYRIRVMETGNDAP